MQTSVLGVMSCILKPPTTPGSQSFQKGPGGPIGLQEQAQLIIDILLVRLSLSMVVLRTSHILLTNDINIYG